MGSRPSSHRLGFRSNGSVGSESENMIRAENAKLLTKIAKLEQLQVPRGVREENEKLREENESLKKILKENRALSETVVSTWRTEPGDLENEAARANSASLAELGTRNITNNGDEEKLSNTNLTVGHQSREGEGTVSDLSSCGEDKNGDRSPLVQKEERRKLRKIHPNSIPSMMSDIDAYGQGLPLPDTENLRGKIGRSKRRQRRNDSGNSTASSVSQSKKDTKGERQLNSSPDRTDQKDVFLGVECLTPGSDESDNRSACSDTKEDLL